MVELESELGRLDVYLWLPVDPMITGCV